MKPPLPLCIAGIIFGLAVALGAVWSMSWLCGQHEKGHWIVEPAFLTGFVGFGIGFAIVAASVIGVTSRFDP